MVSGGILKSMKPGSIVIPIVVVLVAVAGSVVTSMGMGWYETLAIPNLAPAGGVIGAVWTGIYILGAISALLVWNAPAESRRRRRRIQLVMWTFIVNAVLNVLWSVVFFGLHLTDLAVWWAVLLGVSVVVLIVTTWRISKLASLLLIPYALWVGFATHLAYLIQILNG